MEEKKRQHPEAAQAPGRSGTCLGSWPGLCAPCFNQRGGCGWEGGPLSASIAAQTTCLVSSVGPLGMSGGPRGSTFSLEGGHVGPLRDSAGEFSWSACWKSAGDLEDSELLDSASCLGPVAQIRSLPLSCKPVLTQSRIFPHTAQGGGFAGSLVPGPRPQGSWLGPCKPACESSQLGPEGWPHVPPAPHRLNLTQSREHQIVFGDRQTPPPETCKDGSRPPCKVG